MPGSHTPCTPLLPLASPNWESVAVYAAPGRDIVSEQYPPWDPYELQQDPRQYQGQQYPAQQQPYGYQQPYGQQPRQPSLTPDPQYGAPLGQPPYQHQAQYPGTPRGQAYTQWPAEQYDPELHRQRLRDEFTRWQADPGAWQQPQYPPPGRRSWPRSHKVLTALISVFGFFVIIVIATVAGTASHTVTTGQAGSTSSGTPSAASSASSSTARIGSVIMLTGNDPGEKMAVTVTRIISHARPASEFDALGSGKRLYAVQFRLHDIGSAAYSDSPSNGAAVVDSSGQSYQSALGDVAGCESFPGAENIAAGDSGLGCIVFQVPAGAKITNVQFTLDSGMGPQTGQWDIRG